MVLVAFFPVASRGFTLGSTLPLLPTVFYRDMHILRFVNVTFGFLLFTT
jgi:hypothetical protein